MENDCVSFKEENCVHLIFSQTVPSICQLLICIAHNNLLISLIYSGFGIMNADKVSNI